MASPFIFSQNLHQLEEEESNSNSISVQNLTSLKNLRPFESEEFIKGGGEDFSPVDLVTSRMDFLAIHLKFYSSREYVVYT
ncbi:hypothetical protein K7X08_020987 [Anisodus acutangulus]|uniref:Uncharacterized protein n=1 Tax=Anisodus acutangulus TaxID=402998 RepID=A0A9Q1MTI1_9SOLA|nr:hypothetical protein K7X08_020987 [Anisodus acutangulus]